MLAWQKACAKCGPLFANVNRMLCGACSQCSFGVCCRSFHVLCGRHAKAAAAFRHTDGHPLAFCVEHSRERYKRTREKVSAFKLIFTLDDCTWIAMSCIV